MQPFTHPYICDLQRPLHVEQVPGVLMAEDSRANLFISEVLDGNEPFLLDGTVRGYVIRGDGATLEPFNGTYTDNRASIVLPPAAYEHDGEISVVIKVIGSNTKITVGVWQAYMRRSSTNTIIDPEHIVPDISELLAKIEEMETKTAAADAAATKANAKASLANTAAENANANAAQAAQSATDAQTAAAAANAAAAAAPTVLTVTTQYKVADSGSTIPSEWGNDLPATVPQGKWLWIKQTLAWDNGQTSTLYTKAYQGQDGTGAVSTISVDGIVYTADSTTHDVALPLDTAPTQNSSALLTSGAVYTAAEGLSADITAVTPITVDMGTISALPITKTATGVTADMTVDSWEIGTPSAFRSDLTVTTADGSVTLSGSISGSSTLKIKLSRSQSVTAT